MTGSERQYDDDVHQELYEALGAYVLGHLDVADEEAVRTHLAGCPVCRAELAELQPVAAALSTLRRPFAPPLPVPRALDDRIDGVLSLEAGRRRRQRLVRSAGVLAAAAALVVVAVLGIRGLGDDGPAAVVPTPVAVQVAPDRADVTADAGIIAHTWGVEVKLTTAGLARGENFEAYVIEDDGDEIPAGTFVGIGADPMNCNLQSFVLVDDARGFEIRDAADQVVISGNF